MPKSVPGFVLDKVIQVFKKSRFETAYIFGLMVIFGPSVFYLFSPSV